MSVGKPWLVILVMGPLLLLWVWPAGSNVGKFHFGYAQGCFESACWIIWLPFHTASRYVNLTIKTNFSKPIHLMWTNVHISQRLSYLINLDANKWLGSLKSLSNFSYEQNNLWGKKWLPTNGKLFTPVTGTGPPLNNSVTGHYLLRWYSMAWRKCSWWCLST